MFRAGILTVSDSAFRGKRKDAGGALTEILLVQSGGFRVERRSIVPDEEPEISGVLRDWCSAGLDLIVTTGGTGLSPRDVTPEATEAVIERPVPGICEAMRLEGMKKTRRAMLSRAVAGVRGKTLIINLPGSPGGIEDGLTAVLPVLEHAITKIQGDTSPCNG